MKVSPIQNSYNTPKFKGLNPEKLLVKASNMNSCQQRIALGVAGVLMQPAIDRCNKDIDPETREISANRSFAKIAVGTATGIVVRGGCMKAVEKLLQNENYADKLAKITAEDKTQAALDAAKKFIKHEGGAKQYAAVIGTIVAIGVMLFTNFAIDLPVTNWLTNWLDDRYMAKKERQKIKNGEC